MSLKVFLLTKNVHFTWKRYIWHNSCYILNVYLILYFFFYFYRWNIYFTQFEQQFMVEPSHKMCIRVKCQFPWVVVPKSSCWCQSLCPISSLMGSTARRFKHCYYWLQSGCYLSSVVITTMSCSIAYNHTLASVFIVGVSVMHSADITAPTLSISAVQGVHHHPAHFCGLPSPY